MSKDLNWQLIAGLGNPDKEYDNTYHNAGFLAVRYLTREGAAGTSFKQLKNFEYCRLGKARGIVFLKPRGFMNESGRAVKAAAGYFKIGPERILIIHDDSDIKLGDYKLSFGRNSAGHKGVQSIIEALKTKNFWRLRLGIRRESGVKAERFVLKKMAPGDKSIFEKNLAEIRSLYFEI
jgi:PTH1 family peptidyl-tRNA hydrolase